MWPFSTAKRVVIESDGLAEDLADIKLRLKNLEREHDDLHAAYRRLRGGLARDQVGQPKAPPREELQDDPREPGFDKDALRRKYLGRRPGGNGQS
jgi:hypothetical protein